MTGLLAAACAAICMLAGGIVYLILRERRQQKQLEKMTDYLMQVQDRRSLPELGTQAEGRLGILQSEICKLTTALYEQYGRVSEKNRYLEDMLSNISHQIKTPLSAITLMTDLLKSGKLTPEETRRCLARIDKQTEHLTWLVRTLLTLAQLDAGTLTLKEEEVPVQALLDEICDTLAILADVRDVAMICRIPEDMMLTCDRHWTREALMNIIKNCLEHTPPGGQVEIEASSTNLASVFVISDTGEGIAPQDLPHLFDRFYRGAGAQADSVGIGLALSRQLILAQNGTLEAGNRPAGKRSEDRLAGDRPEERGAVFTVRLYRR